MQVSMGEGGTPLLTLDPMAPDVRVKVEYIMPTLSFKDRGAVVLVAKAAEMGVRRLVADSSGNAGTAVAAYAARAGIAAEIFVPVATSPKKVAQIEAHGATVRRIEGSREDTAAAAVDAVMSTSGVFYASHVYNPLFYTGTQTFAFEVWEQLGRRLPDAFVLPAGNGTLVLGVSRAIDILLAQGLIERSPVIHAVQSTHCAPLTAAYLADSAEPLAVTTRETVAEGIAIATPVRGAAILGVVRASGGRVVSVDDDAVLATRSRLAARGLYVEPTAAAPLAALDELGLGVDADVVLPLAGAGLKAS
jgi:threonine synthase